MEVNLRIENGQGLDQLQLKSFIAAEGVEGIRVEESTGSAVEGMMGFEMQTTLNLLIETSPISIGILSLSRIIQEYIKANPQKVLEIEKNGKRIKISFRNYKKADRVIEKFFSQKNK